MTNCHIFRPDSIPAAITNSAAGRQITNASPVRVYAMLDSLRRRGKHGAILPFGKHEAAERGVDTPSRAARAGSVFCQRPACEYHHTRNMLYRPKHRAENGQPSDIALLESFGFNVEEGL